MQQSTKDTIHRIMRDRDEDKTEVCRYIPRSHGGVCADCHWSLLCSVASPDLAQYAP